MNTPSPAPVIPPALAPTPMPTRKKRRWLLYTFLTFCTLALMVVASVALTVWWLQRPIKPVVLSATEKAAVEAKVEYLTGGARSNGVAVSGAAADESLVLDPPYQPGAKVLTLTDREINGLLNANTDLGQNIRLEFARDAINAYFAVPVPQDSPIAAGRMIRARGRFSLSFSNGELPRAVLEDITVFGLSLPNAWLGGLKGENLLAEVMGKREGQPLLPGLKSLQLRPGALVIEVED
jgi:hypothetical protein